MSDQPADSPISGWYRTADGALLCPLCYARAFSQGAVEAEPDDAEECDACGRSPDEVEDLLSNDQLQRLAAGIMTVDEMIAILFDLGDIF